MVDFYGSNDALEVGSDFIITFLIYLGAFITVLVLIGVIAWVAKKI